MTAPSAPPLVRRPDDRVVRGVCAAVGRTTGTDPVLWRVVIGVLTVFGGSGLLLYAAGWLLIPEEGHETSIAQHWVRDRNLSRTGVVALVVAAAVVLAVLTGDGRGAAPLLAVGLLAYVVLRHPAAGALSATARTVTDDPAVPSTATTYGAPLGRPLPATPSAGGDPGAPEAWPPLPARRRSALGLLTFSAALLVVATLLGLAASGLDGITAGRVLAAALLVVGVGLLIGARWGRARGLVLLALLLAVALGVTASARVPVALSAGERTWLVTGSSDHRLGVGEAILDLRPLAPGPSDPSATDPLPLAGSAQPIDVEARLGAGNLRLLLPAGLHLQLTAHVAAGQVVLPGEPDPLQGTRLTVMRTYGPDNAPLVHLDADLGAGQLEVRRDAS